MALKSQAWHRRWVLSVSSIRASRQRIHRSWISCSSWARSSTSKPTSPRRSWYVDSLSLHHREQNINRSSTQTADSENNIFLRTLNPHNPTLTAGGSSGGEGALIALGGSILGIGTDIGGSIRIPSVCCGTYGFKPSSHRVPYSGLASPGKSGSPAFPAVAGPLASNFSDLEFLLKSVIEAKPWDYDGTALAIPWRSALPEKRTLRVGVLAEDPKWACWPPVRRAIATAVDKLRAAGHDIVQLTDAPSVDEGLQMAYASFGLDNSQTMGRNILASGEPFVGSVQRTLDLMTPKEGGWSLEEVFDLNVKKADYFMRWNKVFAANNLDCVLGPGAQTTATPHDTYGHVPYTAVWNTLEVSRKLNLLSR